MILFQKLIQVNILQHMSCLPSCPVYLLGILILAVGEKPEMMNLSLG